MDGTAQLFDGELLEFVAPDGLMEIEVPAFGPFAEAVEVEMTFHMMSLDMAGLLRRVEKIVGGIRDADFLVDVAGVAAGGRSFATLGIEALDSGSA